MINFVYAANRRIGFLVLKLFIKKGLIPKALLLSKNDNTNYSLKMKELLPNVPVIWGKSFRSNNAINLLKSFNIDYIISIHFPFIIPKDILSIPKIGTINLHPSFLPFNKGWHTPTWAIYEKTPFGATLHWVDEGIDTGDIIIQKKVDISSADTADSLYQKAIQAELEIMKEFVLLIKKGELPRIKQQGSGTIHFKSDIEKIRKINIDEYYKAEDLINKIRSLTTNNINECSYFIKDGKKYLVQIKIHEDN
jgi:methionyl-tRNA formyltransferase